VALLANKTIVSEVKLPPAEGEGMTKIVFRNCAWRKCGQPFQYTGAHPEKEYCSRKHQNAAAIDRFKARKQARVTDLAATGPIVASGWSNPPKENT
jgi:hypothetical protein